MEDTSFNRPLIDNQTDTSFTRPLIDQNNPQTDSQTIDFHRPIINNSILPTQAEVTQQFGNYNPSVEKFSGGVNYGADFGVGKGTPVNLPVGNWKVVDSFDKAKHGYIGDNENSGYGNSVMVQNQDTGEKLRFSHLSKVDVTKGQDLTGGVIGQSGDTGNATGPHLDLEYYNQKGKISDVLKSKYKVTP